MCSVEETFEITSMPTKTLRTKIVSQTIGSLMPASPSPAAGPSIASRVGSWQIAPSRVTQEPITISSSKSGANGLPRPSSPVCVIRVTMLTMFWA